MRACGFAIEQAIVRHYEEHASPIYQPETFDFEDNFAPGV
jgi:hypothetical protein